MKNPCENIRHLLVERPGINALADHLVHKHVEVCEDCRLFAADQARLADILESVLPPADLPLQERIVQAVQIKAIRRRRMALAPVAASVFLVLAGISALGGVPAASMAASLPSWAGGGWPTLVAMVVDFVTGLRTVAIGLAAVISGPIALGAAMIVAAGLGATVLISKRWRRHEQWSARF